MRGLQPGDVRFSTSVVRGGLLVELRLTAWRDLRAGCSFQTNEKCLACPDLTFSRSNSVSCTKCPVSNAVECVGGQLELEAGYWWEAEGTRQARRRILANTTIVNIVSPADARKDLALAGITPDTYFHRCPSETACIIGQHQRSVCANGTGGFVAPSRAAGLEVVRSTHCRYLYVSVCRRVRGTGLCVQCVRTGGL